VTSLDDLKLAPFHLLATEGKVHTDRDHVWHMETLKRLSGGLLLGDALHDRRRDGSRERAEGDRVVAGVDRTRRRRHGGKPFDFVARGPRGLVQPAVKCRGREYLRIIYGPEYTMPENLERLRARGLSTKRSLALREFALGVEALNVSSRKEPLRRVHECVFGVLALESEPVDPRL
jgi:protein phosphatase